jgi:hypothetical protein
MFRSMTFMKHVYNYGPCGGPNSAFVFSPSLRICDGMLHIHE